MQGSGSNSTWFRESHIGERQNRYPGGLQNLGAFSYEPGIVSYENQVP
jgi:hypothetical protein